MGKGKTERGVEISEGASGHKNHQDRKNREGRASASIRTKTVKA